MSTKRARRCWVAICAIVGMAAVPGIANATVTYTYDDLGRITSITYDDGRRVTYTYDAAGNRTQHVVDQP